MLAWDVLVLNGYLALNLAIPFYVHYCHYRGPRAQVPAPIFPFVVLAIFWAISIHTVTAFLFSASYGPSLLEHRAAGAALHRHRLRLRAGADHYRAAADPSLARAIRCRILSHRYAGTDHDRRTADQPVLRRPWNCSPTSTTKAAHAASVRYLYFGLDGTELPGAPWVWSALAMNRGRR
jgi:hypothetical protein